MSQVNFTGVRVPFNVSSLQYIVLNGLFRLLNDVQLITEVI